MNVEFRVQCARAGTTPDGEVRARSGRRPGRSSTREAILAAAQREFAQRGYDGATIRGIAKGAGVDPALVHHFFGHKDLLFAECMQLPILPSEQMEALSAGPDGLGEWLVRLALQMWAGDGESNPMLALIRSAAGHESAARMLREYLTREVLARIATALEVPSPELRAALAGSQLVGLAMSRFIVGIEPLASAPDEELVAYYGPVLQHYLTGELTAPVGHDQGGHTSQMTVGAEGG